MWGAGGSSAHLLNLEGAVLEVPVGCGYRLLKSSDAEAGGSAFSVEAELKCGSSKVGCSISEVTFSLEDAAYSIESGMDFSDIQNLNVLIHDSPPS